MKRVVSLLLIILIPASLMAVVFTSKTTLYSTASALSGWYTENTYSPVAYFNGDVYFIMLDSTLRPIAGKISGGITTLGDLEKDYPDYRAFDDGHHEFSIGIDRDGYIHVAGDMHNFPDAEISSSLPSAYSSTTILYWKSKYPEDITDFDFMGGSSSEKIPGENWSYGRFVRDRNDKLYYVSRTLARQQYWQNGGRGLGIYSYDETTKSWTAYGAQAPIFDASYPVVCWEESGQNGGSYQQYKADICFDKDNRMYLATGMNTQNGPAQVNSIIFAYSDDGGVTYRKMDGSSISLPMQVASGSRQADVVDSVPSAAFEQPSITYGFGNDPAIQYSAEGSHYYRYWTGSGWSGRITSPVQSMRGRIIFNEHDNKLLFINIQSGTVYGKDSFTGTSESYNAGETLRYYDIRTLQEYNFLDAVSWKASAGSFEVMRLKGLTSITENSPTITMTPTTSKTITVTPTQTPALTKALFTIPGKVECEDYLPGEGSGYHDTDSTNDLGAYRDDGVDIEECSDTEGGYNVGLAYAGEWLKYSLDVQETGTYSIGVRVARNGAGGAFHLEIDGVDVTGEFNVPDTGGWQSWQDISAGSINISQGIRTLTLVMDSGSSSVGNFNHIEFIPESTPSHTLIRTFTQTPTLTNVYSFTPTKTNTQPDTATWTFTETKTGTPTQADTRTFTASRTHTFSGTATRTFTPTFTRTVTPSDTFTFTRTYTPAATETGTNMPSPSPTLTGTYTAIIINTGTATPSITFTSTPTSTAAKTHTPVNTGTATMTPAGSASSTPKNTITFTPHATFTSTTALINTATSTATVTPGETGKKPEIINYYPNPINPFVSEEIVIIAGNIDHDVDSLELRIYTPAFRKIREEKFEKHELKAMINNNTAEIRFASRDLRSLARGVYYIMVIIEKDGKKKKAKTVGNIIIMK